MTDAELSFPEGVVVHDEVVRRRAPWSHVVRRGETLRIIDLEGNQAVDCVLHNAADTRERYSAPDTMVAQANIYLVTGTVLISTEGTPMMTITGTTCERHDTIGGACSKESNTLRYGHHTFAQHACVENFVLEESRHGMGKRDIQSNINWFMNVPVDDDGTRGDEPLDHGSALGRHRRQGRARGRGGEAGDVDVVLHREP
jgi:urea carboxylase-associated protein 1